MPTSDRKGHFRSLSDAMRIILFWFVHECVGCVCVFAFVTIASTGKYQMRMISISSHVNHLHSLKMHESGWRDSNEIMNENDMEWDNVVWLWLWIVEKAIDLTPKVFLHRRRHYSFKLVRSRSRLVDSSICVFCSLILSSLVRLYFFQHHAFHGKWMQTESIDEMKLLLRY